MKKIMFPLVCASLITLGCAREEPTPQEQEPTDEPKTEVKSFHLHFEAVRPEFVMDDDAKALLDDGNVLKWTGKEKASILIGKELTTTTSKKMGLQVGIPYDGYGFFDGDIDLGAFSEEDVKGLVVPHDSGSFYYYNTASKQYNFYMPIASSQVQKQNGKLNAGYFPFFAKASLADMKAEAGKVTLSSAGSLLLFNVYGKHPYQGETEVLKSIAVTAGGDGDHSISGSCEWTVGGASFSCTGSNEVSVSLEEAVSIADKTKQTGIKLFSTVALADDRTLTQLVVTTDKAVYTKDISKVLPKKDPTARPRIDCIQVNLSEDGWKRQSEVFYSIDGGNTWIDELPSTSFSTLSVKTGEGSVLTLGELEAIKDAMLAQSAAVSLDLSAADYESEEFPQVFGSSTNKATDVSKCIAGISFPRNVTVAGASAFRMCTNITHIDLNNVTELGHSALRGCNNAALTEVDLTKVKVLRKFALSAISNAITDYGDVGSIVTVEHGAFRSNKLPSSLTFTSLREILGDPEDPEPDCGAFTCYRAAQKTMNTIVLPAIENIGWCAFEKYTGLTTVDLGEKLTTIGDRAFNGCTGIANLFFRSKTPPSTVSETAFTNVKDIAVIVPTSEGGTVKAAYEKAFAKYIETQGWQIVEEDKYSSGTGEAIVPSGPGNMVGYNILSDVAGMIAATTPSGYPMAIAHRGCWFKETDGTFYIPENSLAGIRMAKRFGYTGVECDVKKTNDGVMVLMHDASINRTMRNASDYSAISGSVKVASTDFATLRSKYVLESSDPAGRVQIPTLEEFLLECKAQGIIPMLHSIVPESYAMAQSIMGNKWIAFGTDYDIVKSARSVSDCLILYSSNLPFPEAISKTRAIGGWCGVSSMTYSLYTDVYIDALKRAGFEVQASVFPSPHEQRARRDGVTIELSDFYWNQTVGRTPAQTGSRSYSALATGNTWQWTADKKDFQALIVRLDFVGSIQVEIPTHSIANTPSHTYTFTRSTRGEEFVCVRLYKTAPTVTVKALTEGTSVAASAEVYEL